MRIAATVRRLRPDLQLILGGPHVTLVYSAREARRQARRRGRARASRRRAAREPFDVLVRGDGELAIFEALSRRAAK